MGYDYPHWIKYIVNGFIRVLIYKPINYTHMLHGAGIFTYMTGWLLGQM